MEKLNFKLPSDTVYVCMSSYYSCRNQKTVTTPSTISSSSKSANLLLVSSSAATQGPYSRPYELSTSACVNGGFCLTMERGKREERKKGKKKEQCKDDIIEMR